MSRCSSACSGPRGLCRQVKIYSHQPFTQHPCTPAANHRQVKNTGWLSYCHSVVKGVMRSVGPWKHEHSIRVPTSSLSTIPSCLNHFEPTDVWNIQPAGTKGQSSRNFPSSGKLGRILPNLPGRWWHRPSQTLRDILSPFSCRDYCFLALRLTHRKTQKPS
jgi:hypothetical protein